MGFKKKEKVGFFNAVESLKKYRRADLIDDKGRNLLEILYTDLLPDDYILQKSLKENTTFLIGRKGTGKSTIFLRMEQEIRKRDDYIPCYIDVKTIYESSHAKIIKFDYIKKLLPKEIIEKYLIERTFIQNILSAIQDEIQKRTNNILINLTKIFISETKIEKVQKNLEELKKRIIDNNILQNIEIPILKEITYTDKKVDEKAVSESEKRGGVDLKAAVKINGVSGGIKTDSEKKYSIFDKDIFEMEKQFSKIFLQVFQINDIILEIKKILKILKIKHLFILLDDFSEIDDYAIKIFVDVILAPLNNWSEEFVKFKIAAYPSRIYYGKIDPGKIDIINLDFYNLYSEFDRDKMEENAIDFTKRIIEKRISHFTGKDADYFFDMKRHDISDYYDLLFQVSMNVPRIMGYILSYCYQNRIILNRQISKADIESASQRYYSEKLLPFFEVTTYSLLSIDEKISILQLKELIELITGKLLEIKRRIITKDLKGSIYIHTQPYSSHFYFDPRLEEFIKTMELNFFISKYNDLSDKDGNLSSIYCINYGLAKKSNLLWGKPKGNIYRKYFIERPFNFNRYIKDFFNNTKRIHCVNQECNENFSIDDLEMLKKYNFICPNCGSKVIMEPISKKLKDKLNKIDKSIFLPLTEIKILSVLKKSKKPMYGREISVEIDYSKYSIAWKCKKLSKKFDLVIRKKESKNLPYKYELSDKSKDIYLHLL